MKPIEQMRKDFGDSDEASRKAATEAHGDMESLKEWAKEWAEHHNIVGTEGDIIVAYATAVDLGYRIGSKAT
ncbi:hypothetical protein LCGC14_1963330 [marine sediment metagenome]|uniref:Uncharacterized protein n=1 Tax=marine sediment metagenome TaxID=412755 RepID=A0A0F9G298_9ZZZZ